MYSGKTFKNIENALKNGLDLEEKSRDAKAELVNLIIQSTIMEFSIFSKDVINIEFNILQKDDLISINLLEKAGYFGGGKNREIGIISIPYNEFAISFKKKIAEMLFTDYEFDEDKFWDRTEVYIPKGVQCDEFHKDPKKELIAKEDLEISYNDAFPLDDNCLNYTKALLNMYIDVIQTKNDTIFTLDDAEALLVRLDLKNYTYLSSMRRAIDEFFKEEIKERNVDSRDDVGIEEK